MEPSESDISTHSEEHRSIPEFMETLDDPFDAFHPLESKPFIPFHISAPTLYRLPREIRDFVYADLVVAGKLNIFRTSKAVCQEATQLLYKRGICRMVFYTNVFPSGMNFPFRKLHAGAIQNLDIQLLISSHYHRVLRVIKLFRGSSVRRQSCHIAFASGLLFYFHPGGPLGLEQLLPALRRLTGFKLLSLKIRNPRPVFHSKLLRVVNRRLEVSLGAGVLHRKTEADQEILSLEFHPRDHWEACQARQSPGI